MNPYEDAIRIISKTLEDFDDDNKIPCFGFGDATTKENYVFSLFPDNRSANGVEELVDRYKELVASKFFRRFLDRMQTKLVVVKAIGNPGEFVKQV